MVKIIDGDLLKSGADIICHQVNCQGVMGSGVAKQIKEKYPEAYEEYKRLCDGYTDKAYLLGVAQRVCCCDEDATIVCNLFAQENYGYNGKCFTDIKALRKCLEDVHSCYNRLRQGLFGVRIAMPYKIGCVRGGANWEEVLAMIEEIFEDGEVELWRLDKG